VSYVTCVRKQIDPAKGARDDRAIDDLAGFIVEDAAFKINGAKPNVH